MCTPHSPCQKHQIPIVITCSHCHTHTCARTHTHAHAHTHTHTHTHTHRHTHTHTHTHTHCVGYRQHCPNTQARVCLHAATTCNHHHTTVQDMCMWSICASCLKGQPAQVAAGDDCQKMSLAVLALCEAYGDTPHTLMQYRRLSLWSYHLVCCRRNVNCA